MRSVDVLLGIAIVILFIWASFLTAQNQKLSLSLISYINQDILTSTSINKDCPVFNGKNPVLPKGKTYVILYLPDKRTLCFYPGGAK